MVYIATVKYDSWDFQRKILDEVKNIDFYDDTNHFYWVGFPEEDDRNDSDESSIIENTNTPIHNCKSKVSVYFLDPKWLKKLLE